MRNIFAILVGLLIGLLMSTVTVFAVSIVHVTICHRTGSATNPYTINDVSVHSVDDATGLNGHGDHLEDAWQPFIFDGITYPGRNTGLFGSLINEDCSLIQPTPTPTNTEVPSATPTNTSTSTATATNTSSPTATSTPTKTATPTPTASATPTSTHTGTPTETFEPFPTPVDTEVPSATPTYTTTPIISETPTNTPTVTKTNDPTNTPTLPPYNTGTPTQTSTRTPTPTYTPTMTPESTSTPRPPIPAEGNSSIEYKGKLLGTIFMDGNSYELYQGINAPDGTLQLPSAKRGASLYGNTIWVHRAWNSGWLNLKVGDLVILLKGNKFSYYQITETNSLPYGYYPPDGNMYIATCMSTNGINWTNVELFTLQLVDTKAK